MTTSRGEDEKKQDDDEQGKGEEMRTMDEQRTKRRECF